MAQKFRYSLRKQNEISKRLGSDYLKLLLDSLNAYFKDRTEPIEEIGEVKDNKETGRTYVFIPSSFKNYEIEFQFVLLSKTMNVYNLSYFSSIG